MLKRSVENIGKRKKKLKIMQSRHTHLSRVQFGAREAT